MTLGILPDLRESNLERRALLVAVNIFVPAVGVEELRLCFQRVIAWHGLAKGGSIDGCSLHTNVSGAAADDACGQPRRASGAGRVLPNLQARSRYDGPIAVATDGDGLLATGARYQRDQTGTWNVLADATYTQTDMVDGAIMYRTTTQYDDIVAVAP